MLRRFVAAFIVVLCCVGFAVAAEAKNPLVQMETTMGSFKIELFEKEAPLSVKNFLGYVKDGYFVNTVFHRIIPGFMAQGGGLTKELQPKPGQKAAIKNEAANGLKNDRGTIAMARTGDPDSATSQFFVNVVNNNMLNRPNPDGHGYAVFGKVVDGMDVVDKIVNAAQDRKNSVFQNVPKEPIIIKSVKILN